MSSTSKGDEPMKYLAKAFGVGLLAVVMIGAFFGGIFLLVSVIPTNWLLIGMCVIFGVMAILFVGMFILDDEMYF
jgi:hypothetical protein